MNPQALATLRDVHLPPAPLLWHTVEWWITVALATTAIVWCAFRFVRRRKLRAALRELSALAAAHRIDGDNVQLARSVSVLLKRYAAARFPGSGIETLSGTAWTAFLDQHGGRGAFRNGAGAALESMPYQAAGTVDADALLTVVRAWLQENPQ